MFPGVEVCQKTKITNVKLHFYMTLNGTTGAQPQEGMRENHGVMMYMEVGIIAAQVAQEVLFYCCNFAQTTYIYRGF